MDDAERIRVWKDQQAVWRADCAKRRAESEQRMAEERRNGGLSNASLLRRMQPRIPGMKPN